MNITQPSHIIVALDFSTDKEALRFVEKLDPSLCQLKIGITMYTRYGPFFVEQLMHKGYSIFLDLKFHDIPHQVAGACHAAAALGVWMLTLHTLGGVMMCETAANAIANYTNKPYLVGVTILTSMNNDDSSEIGLKNNLDKSVQSLAKIAENSGLDGVVCSPIEVSNLREQLKKKFLLVTPGIRLEKEAANDQKRIMTPHQAIESGSDYLVMGRSITQANDPVVVLKQLAQL